MCHYQVGIMEYLEDNLAKCATIANISSAKKYKYSIILI